MNPINRRGFLKIGLTGGSLLVAGPALAAGLCQPGTPEQTEGPFYPVNSTDPNVEKDADLTVKQGSVRKAEGQVIYVSGLVRDQDCQAVEGALVEIWQACHSGRYDHPNDPNSAPLDPHFQYWGQSITDARGHYAFKTIIPGAYPAAANWVRPPHIHFKVHKRGYHELTSQLYFAGEELNDQDLILKSLSVEEQKKVIVSLRPTVNPVLEEGSKEGQFDITITAVQNP